MLLGLAPYQGFCGQLGVSTGVWELRAEFHRSFQAGTSWASRGLYVCQAIQKRRSWH